MRKKPQLATIRPFVGGGPALLAPEANIQLTAVHDCAPVVRAYAYFFELLHQLPRRSPPAALFVPPAFS
jgi:hypothetical protein